MPNNEKAPKCIKKKKTNYIVFVCLKKKIKTKLQTQKRNKAKQSVPKSLVAIFLMM